MNNCRRPLRRSILIGMLLFLAALCLLMGYIQNIHYSQTLYGQYQNYIRNVLSYAASGIDADDLAECIRTGEPSEKYGELQSFLDGIKDNMELHFLYVIIPLNTQESDNVRNVIAAVSREEYENEAESLVYLNQLTGDSYSPETARKYLDAYRSGELSFFEEKSEWGDDYTGLLPLFDSAGEPVAALCMDVESRQIHEALREHTVHSVAVILLVGLAFAGVFLLWTHVNITRPIRELEESVVGFAGKSHKQRDLDALVLRLPEIHTGSEVESLARAIEKMGVDMRDYAGSILSTEKELSAMYQLAHKDALTHVGNKTAYEQYVRGLNERLKQEPVAFAVLMLDMNDLKHINDVYGHEKGDSYLKRGCAVFCEIFHHSPVFRVGGDEFAAILMGKDFEAREALVEKARAEFLRSESDGSLEPWERVSAALGEAVYVPGSDSSVDAVLDRADRNMYSEKQRLKARGK